MKLISLDIEIGNATHDRLREVFTQSELERLVKTFLIDTARVSNPKEQEKILRESQKVFKQLEEVNLKDV